MIARIPACSGFGALSFKLGFLNPRVYCCVGCRVKEDKGDKGDKSALSIRSVIDQRRLQG